MKIEEKLKILNIELPEAPSPVASYVPAKLIGDLIYISGQGPIINGIKMFEGKVGGEVTLEDGYKAARYCALNMLAQLKNIINELDLVEEIVSIHGFVASTSDFYDQPKVVNGASELMIEVFGDRGKHTRCAVGLNVLPGNIPTEIEMIVRVKI